MGTDDRDKLVRKDTPVKGVRAQTSPGDEWEPRESDLTPVEGSIEMRTEKRAEAAAGNSKNALKVVTEMQKDHVVMKTELAGIKAKVEDLPAMKEQITTLSDHVGNLREGFGEVSGKLDVISGQLTLDQQNAAHAQRTKITFKSTVKGSLLENTIKVVGALIIAGGSALITYLATR